MPEFRVHLKDHGLPATLIGDYLEFKEDSIVVVGSSEKKVRFIIPLNNIFYIKEYQ